MPESEFSQENIDALRTDVEGIRQMQRFTIAANDNHRTFIEDHLGDMKGAPEVYLALGEGPQNLDTIMKAVDKSRAQASKICTHLYEQGLIQKIADPSNRKSKLFMWTDLESMLKVSKIAKKIIKNGKKTS